MTTYALSQPNSDCSPVVISGGPILPSVPQRTGSISVVTTAGTIAAGASAVIVSNTGSATATVQGTALAAGQQVSWSLREVSPLSLTIPARPVS